MIVRPLAAVLAVVALSNAAVAAPSSETRPLAGLQAPAEIVIDRNGIAHLYAASPRDAFFLQGYNAARDRLWQIDLWRKRGLGLLSASFGPAYIEQDRAARLFLYRGDMAAEWAAYAPDAKGWTEAFVAGINAYVAETRSGARPLPPEFGLTGSLPDLWAAEDVVRIRSHALASNVDSEVERARVACAAGLAADRLRDVLEPPHIPRPPEGLDLCDVPADVLATYTLGTQAVRFDAASVRPLAVASTGVEDGSNNWVVAPSRTETGRPILANDPHRAHALPSLRYLVHMEAPGLSLIGAGEPALPGVSLGHNGRIAFGLTINPVDQQDLYAYTLKPDAPLSYRYGEGWEAMRVVRERIAVKGEAAPREVDLHYTRHGPVLASANGRAWALRSIWSEPGTSAYFASTWYAGAKDWSDFRRAQSAWGAPPLNLVYADIDGHIGWAVAARTPVREGWDGLLPVPGDGRYEWRGFRNGASLPSVRDPEQGWFATANEYNVTPAQARDLAYEWSNPSRANRIKAVLGGDRRVSLADSAALQTDTTSPFAAEATALLRGLDGDAPGVAEAIRRLTTWDHRVESDSWEAAVYEVWARELPASVAAWATPERGRALLAEVGSPRAAVAWLKDEASAGDRRAVLLDSLAAALAKLETRLGPDRAAWRWGRLHAITFTPATAALADPARRSALTVGPFEQPGSDTTPRAAGYNADFRMIHGASVRLVIDVGGWDNSLAINTPGQSGDPASPHYRDLAPLWAKGEYVPLPYTRPAVDAAAETVIRLTPTR